MRPMFVGDLATMRPGVSWCKCLLLCKLVLLCDRFSIEGDVHLIKSELLCKMCVCAVCCCAK